MAGWVAGSAGIKANSASNKVRVEAEAELGTSLKIHPSFSGGGREFRPKYLEFKYFKPSLIWKYIFSIFVTKWFIELFMQLETDPQYKVNK